MTTVRRKKTTGRNYSDDPVLTPANDDNKREEDKRSGTGDGRRKRVGR
jgi:hypothetical protein